MTALGGRGAEEVMLGSITTGAENDLQKVTLIAHNMVARYGMSDRLGLISFSERSSPFGAGGDFGQRDYSDATAAVIDEETRELVQTAYQRVKQLLIEHKPTLERIAAELRRHETLDARQLGQILIETGVSLAEVAPIPNAETVGLQPTPTDVSPEQPAIPGSVNNPSMPYTGGLGPLQN
jgi:cell division protease FtsH